MSSLVFVAVAPESADLIFGVHDFSVSVEKQQAAGFAFFPNRSKIAGDIFMDEDASESFQVYLHEIGHALGLEHPFEGEFVLPDELDNLSSTIMSFTGPFFGGLGTLDAPAIQSMYGGPDDKPENPVVPVIGFSDLFISNISFFTSLEQGDEFTFRAAATNSGQDPLGGSFTIAYVLSLDEVFDETDIVIGSVLVGDLDVGETKGLVDVDIVILADIPPSDYFLGAVADLGDGIIEANELNNVLFTDTALAVTGPQPNARTTGFPLWPQKLIAISVMRSPLRSMSRMTALLVLKDC